MPPSARLTRRVLAALAAVAFSLVWQPWSAAAGAASLGTARGARGAEMRFEHGVRWLPLGGRALPVLGGARIRTTTGAVAVDLADGARLTLMPFSEVRFEAAGPAFASAGPAAGSGAPAATAPAAVLEYGRLGVRLPPASRLTVLARGTRVRPAAGRAASGEIVAAPDLLAVRAAEGALAVADAQGTARVVEAGASPLLIPENSPAAAVLFTGVQPPAPAGARAAYTAAGENLGYVGPDGRLVVHPGFTRDLTGPFPAAAVRRALARVPPDDRPRAELLLDVHGAYLGYVAGPQFFAVAGPAGAAQAVAAGTEPTAPAPGPASTSGAMERESGLAAWRPDYTVGLLAIVGGIGAAVAVGVADDDDEASPTGP